MLSAFQKYSRCPDKIIDAQLDNTFSEVCGFFSWGGQLVLYGHNTYGHVAMNTTDELPDIGSRVKTFGTCCVFPFDPSEVMENLWHEKYMDNAIHGERKVLTRRRIIRSVYYAIRPLFPVRFRKYLQRLALRNWDQIPFPTWPVDCTVENLVEKIWLSLLNAQGLGEMPFIWFWPDGYSSCCILTHDVETKAGREFCPHIMEMEGNFGMKSSFGIIPEKRYEVTQEFLQQIRQSGCEVYVHGLSHDGNLFRSEADFRERAKKINEYAAKYGSVGFRSPAMYRRPEWYDALELSYDMSMPNVGHLEAQRGGCCTVMPYFIGNILELPLTTIQDYFLFNILKGYSISLWQQQIELIIKKHGLINIVVHPDYVISKKEGHVYQRLLEYLSQIRSKQNIWFALPKEVDEWWRQGSHMELIEVEGKWQIKGSGMERASVAYAVVENNKVVYKIE